MYECINHRVDAAFTFFTIKTVHLNINASEECAKAGYEVLFKVSWRSTNMMMS